MSRLTSLRACASLSDLAAVLRIKPAFVSYTLYKVPDGRKYTSFEIPKKSGGVRVIEAPISQLALLQRRLSDLLYDCLKEIEISGGLKINCEAAHGFKKQRSIITNAYKHTNRRYVFNVDLSDFFPSIHFGRIKGFFQKNRNFQLNEKVAEVIAQIACHRGRLPQGSPSSPILSNLVSSVLDVHLQRLATKHRCTYTRYADDITFSTNERVFPAALAVPIDQDARMWRAGDELVGRVVRAGFSINRSKTRMQFRESRQTVTGMIANKKVNVPAEYYKRTRAMCHHLFSRGSLYDIDVETKVGTDNLRGRLSFIYLVRAGIDRYTRIPIGKGEKESEVRPSYLRLYKALLDYLAFHANEIPTIIFEGKTDRVYIISAIKSLRKKYPSLWAVEDGAFKIRANIFRYSKIADAVQNLGGGTGDLSRFIHGYEGAMRPFSSSGQSSPVIIVVDNDSGASNVFSAIKSVSKFAGMVDGSKDFYHVIRNLYVIPLPKIAGAETQIEDFFGKDALSITVRGKSFQGKDAGFDPAKHYSKEIFSDQIRKLEAKIDFSGFSAILDRIVMVIDDHKKVQPLQKTGV